MSSVVINNFQILGIVVLKPLNNSISLESKNFPWYSVKLEQMLYTHLCDHDIPWVFFYISIARD